MTLKSFIARTSKAPTKSHRRAPKMEKSLAVRLGGKTTPGSGNKQVKGDVRVARLFRIEAKTTKHSSFAVTLDMVRKLEEAALMTGEMPAIVVEFNEDGKPIAQLVVMPAYALDRIGVAI